MGRPGGRADCGGVVWVSRFHGSTAASVSASVLHERDFSSRGPNRSQKALKPGLTYQFPHAIPCFFVLC
jgi:hypothetical protein